MLYLLRFLGSDTEVEVLVASLSLGATAFRWFLVVFVVVVIVAACCRHCSRYTSRPKAPLLLAH